MNTDQDFEATNLITEQIIGCANYKGARIGEHRADLIVACRVVVEMKSVDCASVAT